MKAALAAIIRDDKRAFSTTMSTKSDENRNTLWLQSRSGGILSPCAAAESLRLQLWDFTHSSCQLPPWSLIIPLSLPPSIHPPRFLSYPAFIAVGMLLSNSGKIFIRFENQSASVAHNWSGSMSLMQVQQPEIEATTSCKQWLLLERLAWALL